MRLRLFARSCSSTDDGILSRVVDPVVPRASVFADREAVAGAAAPCAAPGALSRRTRASLRASVPAAAAAHPSALAVVSKAVVLAAALQYNDRDPPSPPQPALSPEL